MATDNSQFFPNRKALSPEFSFTPKPSSVNGRSYRVSIPVSNGQNFSAGSTMVFNIPCGKQRTLLDPTSSYIRYTIKNGVTQSTATGVQGCTISSTLPPNGSTATGSSATAVNTIVSTFGAGLFLDHNAYSIFNTTTLYSGSNMLEYINGCNILYSYILDTNFSYANALSNSLNYGMYVPDTSPLEIRRGTLLANVVATASASAPATTSAYISEQNTFCLPILSALIGMGSSGKFVPIYKIQDVLRLEILLESQSLAFAQLGSCASSYSVISAELELQFVEVDQEGMDLIESTTPMGSPTFIVGSSFRHYVQSLPNSSGIFSCLVPSKLASLKNIIILPRPTSTKDNVNAYSLSSRVNPNFEYFVMKVSGTQCPQKPIFLINSSSSGGYSESLVEIFKTTGSLIGTDKAGLLMATNYNIGASADTTTGVIALKTNAQSYQNAFALALDFELFSSKDTIINGLNCLAESLYFEANIVTAPGESYALDFYACFDNLFIIDQSGYVSSRA
jgi:hypothetical protein